MNSYVRDDGVVMVETKPGCFTRRDSLGSLGLSPLARRMNVLAENDALVRHSVERLADDATGPGIVPPPLAPSHEDLAPEPVEAPPLQSSFKDRVSAYAAADPATPYAGFVEACAAEIVVTAGPAPKSPSTSRPKPAKRSIAAILAEADRTHRARRPKART